MPNQDLHHYQRNVPGQSKCYSRERLWASSRAEHCKRQDEQRQQASTVHSASDQVRVVLEDARFVVAQVELRVEASNQLTEDNTRLRLIVWNVSSIEEQLRHVDLVSRELV